MNMTRDSLVASLDRAEAAVKQLSGEMNRATLKERAGRRAAWQRAVGYRDDLQAVLNRYDRETLETAETATPMEAAAPMETAAR